MYSLVTKRAKTFDLQGLASLSATTYEYDITTVNESSGFCQFIPAPAKDWPSDTIQVLCTVVDQSQMAVYTLNESRHAPFELFPPTRPVRMSISSHVCYTWASGNSIADLGIRKSEETSLKT